MKPEKVVLCSLILGMFFFASIVLIRLCCSSMKTNGFLSNKALWLLVVVIAIILLYQFVVRPMQMDKKLQDCLYGAGVNYVTTDAQMAAYNANCFKQYGH